MKFGRTLASYLYAYLMGGLVTWMCNFVFMRTLCCAIFGEDWGLFAAALIRYFCWPIVAFVFIYLARQNRQTAISASKRGAVLRFSGGRRGDPASLFLLEGVCNRRAFDRGLLPGQPLVAVS